MEKSYHIRSHHYGGYIEKRVSGDWRFIGDEGALELAKQHLAVTPLSRPRTEKGIGVSCDILAPANLPGGLNQETELVSDPLGWNRVTITRKW